MLTGAGFGVVVKEWRMSVERVARARLSGALPAEVVAADVESALFLAVWAWSVGDVFTAHQAAVQAELSGAGGEFARVLVALTGGDAGGGVYDSPAAFRAFIRGGGNVGLYAAVSEAFREVYRRARPASVLDVGVGDGLALVPALDVHRPRVGLVEPSAALLAETSAALEELGVEHESWRVPAQEFVRGNQGRWDVVQSSFALQSLPDDDKLEVLSWICAHASRLVLVEFDVPEVDDVWDPVWFGDCVARVERGLREYSEDRDLVGAGFILPVILGKFSVTARPANFEVSVERWEELLHRAGFVDVVCRELADYWWRPAHLLEASGRSR